MTEPTNDLDQAERIRRLQERRAAAGADRTGPSRAKPRRRHPAAATRWLLGGLSVASFFTIAGTIAVANVDSVGVAQPAAPAPAVATAPATATSAQAAAPAPSPVAATKVAPRVTVVHTTTRGS